MKYHELRTVNHKAPKRVGRGIAAGGGKTAGRGTKGQKARTGSHRRPGFEGGQNPLMQRLPKLHGFRSLKGKTEVVYTGQLEQFAGQQVTTSILAEAGLISNAYVTVKLISKGELTKKVNVKLQAASSSAVDTIQKAGGSFEQIAREPRPATSQAKAGKSTKTKS